MQTYKELSIYTIFIFNYLFFILLFHNRFGRRKAVASGMFISAVASIISVAIPSDRSNTGDYGA